VLLIFKSGLSFDVLGDPRAAAWMAAIPRHAGTG
jgi:hypothetical protein